MSGNRPNVTDEEIGIRAFQIRKARAVERAMERLRKGLKTDYATLTHTEIETISWLFGELWAYVARTEWDDLHFSKLELTDIYKALNLAGEIHDHTRNSVAVLSDVHAMVLAKS